MESSLLSLHNACSCLDASFGFTQRPTNRQVPSAEWAHRAKVGFSLRAALEISEWKFCCKFHSRRRCEDIVYLGLGLFEHIGRIDDEAAGDTDKNRRPLDPSTLPLRPRRFHHLQRSVVQSQL